MVKRLTIWLGLTLAVIAVLVGVGLGLIRYRPEVCRPWLERLLAPPGGRLTIGRLAVRYRPLSLTLKDVDTQAPAEAGYSLKLKSLRLTADPWAGLKGGLWLKHLEVVEPDLTLRPEPAAERESDLSGLAVLLGVERLSVSRGRFKLVEPEGSLETRELSISLEAGRGDELPLEFKGRLRLSRPNGREAFSGLVSGRGVLALGRSLRAEVEVVEGRLDLERVSGELTVAAGLELTPERLVVSGVVGRMARAEVDLGSGVRWQGPIGFKLAGSQTELKTGRSELVGLDVQAAGLGRLTGTLSGWPDGRLSGRLTGLIEEPGAVLAALRPVLPPAWSQAAVWGETPFELKLDTPADRLLIELELGLDEVVLAAPRWKLEADLGGRLSLAGPPAGPHRLLGRIEARAAFGFGRLSAKAVEVEMDLTGRLPQQVRAACRLAVGPFDLTWSSRPIEIGSIEAKGELGLTGGGALEVEDVVVSTAALGEIRGRLALTKAGLSGRGRAEAVDLAALAGLVQSLTGFDLTAWSPTGRADIEAGLAPDSSGRVAETKVSLKQFDLTVFGRPISFGSVEAQADLRFKKGGALEVKDVVVSTAALGEIRGRLALTKAGLSGRGRAEAVDLAVLAGLIKPLTGFEPAAWSLAGRADIEVGFAPGASGGAVEARLELDEIDLASPDGRVMIERGQGRLRFGLDPAEARPLRLDLFLRGGEVLADTVYLNLARRPLEVGVRAREVSTRTLDGLEVSADLGQFGRLKLSGRARRLNDGWDYRARLRLKNADLNEVFQTFIREPLAASRPDLQDLDLSGMADLELDLSGRGPAATIKGRASLVGGGLNDARSGHLVKGLILELPIDYRFGPQGAGRPSDGRPRRWGRIRALSIGSPFGEIKNLDLPLALVPGRLVFSRGLTLPLFDGSLVLDRMTVERPLSRDFEARATVEIRRFDLSLASPPEFPLEGGLAGRLGRVSLNRRRLTTTGGLTGQFFGGRVKTSALTVYRPFSPGRMLAADVTVERLDLGRLTKALKLGKITGKLTARIEGLRLAHGQAVAFNLRAESVAVKGVKQRVSIKAVNSISVLGTGSGLTGLGVTIMAPFFREFPYERIGFLCNLKNDVFTIRGLIREDGVEYLVKKPFLTGINVVNRNPNNQISFKDMLGRLRRVMGGHDQPG